MGKYILYKKEALYLKGIKGCYKTLGKEAVRDMKI